MDDFIEKLFVYDDVEDSNIDDYGSFFYSDVLLIKDIGSLKIGMHFYAFVNYLDKFIYFSSEDEDGNIIDECEFEIVIELKEKIKEVE